MAASTIIAARRTTRPSGSSSGQSARNELRGRPLVAQARAQRSVSSRFYSSFTTMKVHSNRGLSALRCSKTEPCTPEPRCHNRIGGRNAIRDTQRERLAVSTKRGCSGRLAFDAPLRALWRCQCVTRAFPSAEQRVATGRYQPIIAELSALVQRLEDYERSLVCSRVRLCRRRRRTPIPRGALHDTPHRPGPTRRFRNAAPGARLDERTRRSSRCAHTMARSSRPRHLRRPRSRNLLRACLPQRRRHV